MTALLKAEPISRTPHPRPVVVRVQLCRVYEVSRSRDPMSPCRKTRVVRLLGVGEAKDGFWELVSESRVILSQFERTEYVIFPKNDAPAEFSLIRAEEKKPGFGWWFTHDLPIISDDTEDGDDPYDDRPPGKRK